MTDHLMPERMFHLLPPIYDQIGFSEHSAQLVEPLLEFLFKNNWVGRHLLEIGCGTGVAAEYLCEQRMNVTALDASLQMLEVARQRLEGKGYSVDFVHQDIRAYNPRDKHFDLVYSFDTMNYIPKVPHLVTVFQQVAPLVRPEKLFVFDLWTIKGLATLFSDDDEIIYDDEGIFATRRNDFSYETFRLMQHHTFFYEDEGQWIRGDEDHLLRGYPANAVQNMLSRFGFEVRHILNPDLLPYDPDEDTAGRIIIIAEKISSTEGS